MPRPEKVQAVAAIKERIEEAQGVFVTEFRGMSVKQLSELRRSLRDAGAEYKVVKMTLARRAVDELGIDGLTEHLVGPTALTFAKADVVQAAKALRDAGNSYEALVIKAGVLSGGIVVPAEQVATLADIEPREVLLAKIAGAAKAPLFKAAGMFQSFTRDAASMLSQLLEKKEAEGPTAVAEPEASSTEESVPVDDVEDEAPAGEPAGDSAGDSVDDDPAETPTGDAAEQTADEPPSEETTSEETGAAPAADAETSEEE